jgi:chromosomal replication initiator protein
VVDHITEIPLPGRMFAGRPDDANGASTGVTMPAFVAGPENRLVAATLCRWMQPQGAAKSAAQPAPSPGVLPAVLALFGPHGTGKSHLARGLVRHWQTTRGQETADYVTAQDFRRQFTDAIDTDSVVEFRQRLRSRQLLAIDDVHRIPDDDYLLQELRYTLDALEESGHTMVVTSTRPIGTLANMPPDVRARLTSGLMLQLAPPSKAARLRIVRHVSSALNRPLSDEAIHRLAEGLRGAASQLVGALFELCAELPAGQPVGAEHAGRLLSARAARRPDLSEITAVVAKYYKVPQSVVKSKSRKQAAVLARATVTFLARELTGASYQQIGQRLGGRDHTTIMHNYQKIEHELEHDVGLQESVEDMRRILLSR